MPNVKFIISKQNTSRLNNSNNKVDAKQFNCRSAIKLPTQWKILQKLNSRLYKASLKTGQTDKLYYGSCGTSFKLRYNNHNQSFKDNRKLTLLNYQKPFGKTIRAITRNKIENRTPRNSISVWFKNI